MKRIIVGAAAVLIGGIGIGGYLWWNGTNATTDVVYGAQNDSTVLGSETSLASWTSSYFKTRVPGNLQLRTNTENSNASIMGSYFWNDISSRQADQLAVTIGTLHNNSLSEISTAKLRLNDPTDYVVTHNNFAPAGALGFIKNSGGDYETSLIWQNGSHYAVVVASGSSARKAELDQDLANIVANWQWL